MNSIRRHYFILIILAFLFAAPGILAYIFYNHPHWLSASSTNKGELLNPPILLNHRRVEVRKADVKWALVLFSPSACEKRCINQLDKLSRIRLALGRHLYEVESRLLLGPNTPQLPMELTNAMHEQDIHIEKLSTEENQQLALLPNHLAIYIENLDGYLIMAYPEEASSEDIFHDIKQLLNMRK